MDQLINIFIGLVTTFIGFTIGRVWQIAVEQLPYRRTKRFWKPILNGDTQIIVSRFTSETFEEPGLVGGGDALAMREMTSFFTKIKAKRVEVAYVDETAVDREKNLILLGGPDTNAVTKDALALIRPNLRFGYPSADVVEIYDLTPEPGPGNRGHTRFTPESGTIDYGVIIRARNPFNPAKMAVILAGAHGYGSWAAARLALQSVFAERSRQLEPHEKRVPSGRLSNKLSWHLHWRLRFITSSQHEICAQHLECIFRVRIFDQHPRNPEIIILRMMTTYSADQMIGDPGATPTSSSL